jgi:membrane-associated protein
MSLLTDFGDQLLAWMMVYGYPVLGLVLLLAAIGLPVPAGIVAAVAGTLVADSELDPWMCLAVAMLACVCGDLIGYWVGRLGGRQLASTHAGWLGLGAKRLSQAEALFQRWAGPTLVLSRSLIAIAGPAINLLAGASGQDLRAFLAYDALGRVIWVAVYGGLGYAFASNPETAADLATSVSAALFLVGLAVLLGVSGARASVSAVSGGDGPGATGTMRPRGRV